MNVNNEVTIRRYMQDDHSDVKRIFSLGVNEHIATKIRHGLGNPTVLGYLAVMFALGFVSSTFLGFFTLLMGLFLHSFTIFLRYVFYCR